MVRGRWEHEDGRVMSRLGNVATVMVALVVTIALAQGCGARAALEGAEGGADSELPEDAGPGVSPPESAGDGPELQLGENAGTDSVGSVGTDGTEVEPEASAGADATSVEERCGCVDNGQDGTVDEDCEGQICEFELTVSSATSDPACCVIDAPAVGASDVVRVPCMGGRVRVMLGEIELSGSASACEIELAGGSSFLWSDGCEWESQQSIRGRPSDGVLLYTYDELPVVGDDCDTACTGAGEVIVD